MRKAKTNRCPAKYAKQQRRAFQQKARGNNGKGEKTATFKIDVPNPDTYEIRLLYVASANRSTKTPVTVSVGEVKKEITVNQREGSAIGTSLGDFLISDSVTVTVSNRDTDGFVVVDGVQLLPQPQ